MATSATTAIRVIQDEERMLKDDCYCLFVVRGDLYEGWVEWSGWMGNGASLSEDYGFFLYKRFLLTDSTEREFGIVHCPLSFLVY